MDEHDRELPPGEVGELIVRADVQKGSVPAATVSAVNTAAKTADNAC